MKFRISPPWWPVLAVTSPAWVPMLWSRNRSFKSNVERAERFNAERLEQAASLDLPGVDFLDLTVVVEWEVAEGFLGEEGVSYLVRSDLGSMLLDVGFGPARKAFGHNMRRLGISLDDIDALVISQLHADHMGGVRAAKERAVAVPEGLGPTDTIPCFLPDQAKAEGFDAELVENPRFLTAGLATTGPLARALFFLGFTREQALVARVSGKGLVIITGCGHPTIQTILEMVGHMSSEPVYAVIGGLHFPVNGARSKIPGIQLQAVFGTGLPPWHSIGHRHLTEAIDAINRSGARRVLLSAHDTSDEALERFGRELTADTEVLRAGQSYRI